MKSMLLLFSHKLTEDQSKDAERRFGIEKFIYLPEELQNIWSNVPPENGLDKDSLNKIGHWILDNSDNAEYVLVQGDFGATFYIVDFCFKNGFIPVYSTTKRESKEIITGNDRVEKTLVFKHVTFRVYERI